MANPRIPYRMSSSRPRLDPMEGKRILVHLVVNVEHWQFENAMPRTIITPPHGRETVPDVPNFSWADYGMRAGLPRILDLFKSRGLPASASFNAGVIDAYPEAAEAMRDAGWEFIGHGMHQKALNHVEGGEASLIRACLQKIEGFTGQRVRGWLSPGLRETVETPDLLHEAGLDYVCDWVVDDLPSPMTTRGRGAAGRCWPCPTISRSTTRSSTRSSAMPPARCCAGWNSRWPASSRNAWRTRACSPSACIRI